MFFPWNQGLLRPALNRNTLLVWFFLLAGCSNSEQASGPLRLGPPVLPAAKTMFWQDYVEAWANNTSKKETDKPVAEIVLAYVGGGRDFRDPPGSDGYVLRVIPLNSSYREVNLAADVFIGLYRSVDKNDLQGVAPLRLWQISGEKLAEHWVKTSLLDGFMFRLDWGQQTLPPGDYIFLVLMKYQHKGLMESVCQQIEFRSI